MAQTIQLKRSAVASNEPTTVDLGLGELAINTYDGKVFFKKDNGTEYILRFITEDENGNVGLGTVTTPATLLHMAGTDADFRMQNNSYGQYWELNTRNSGTYNIVHQTFGNVIGFTPAGKVGIGAVSGGGATSPRKSFDIGHTTTTLYNVGAGLDAFGEYNECLVWNASDTADTFSGITFVSGTNSAAIAHITLINETGTTNFNSILAFSTRDTGGGVSEKFRIHSNGYIGINEKAPDYRLDINGPIGFTPGSSVTPVDNGDVVFELTSNTSLTVKAKGSDSTVRSLALPLGGTIPVVGSNVQSSASSLTPNIDTYNLFRFTDLATNININAPTGTPYDGQRIKFQITDDGTERSITWNNIFRIGSLSPLETGDQAIPNSTYCDDGFTPYAVYQKTVVFEYNTSRSQWVGVEAYKEDILFDTISYVGGVSGNFIGGDTPSVVLSSGLTGGSRSSVQTGDLVVVFIGSADITDQGMTSMVSGGYTQITELYSDDTYDTNFTAFYKRMGSTPDTSVEMDATGISSIYPFCYSIRIYEAINESGPLDVSAVTTTGINATSPNPGSITPVTAGSVIVIAGAGADSDGITDSNSTTDFHSVSKIGSTSRRVALGAGHVSWSSGAYDASAFTSNASTSGSWCSCTLALRPASLN